MPWYESDAMLQRSQFVAEVLSGEFSFSDTCARFGVSRKTGYKWWRRYEREGVPGLAERSRAPHHSPQQMPEDQARRILEIKTRCHPNWGAHKIRVHLQRRFPDEHWPAESSIGELLASRGLTRPRRRRRRTPPYEQPLSHSQHNNAVWSIDFKGQFPLGNKQMCYPLTVTDNHSRFLLGCQALARPALAPVRTHCERLFRTYGLPDAIRSDNGLPFASRGLAGLSSLSVWWIRLGIRPERIEPGQPQQNGRHERMHQTLKHEATRPPQANLKAQQRRFDDFWSEFNHIRPHEALNDDTPGEWYHPSPRPFPERLPPVEYSSAMTVRRVRRSGEMKWRGGLVHISQALAGEPVGLLPRDNERWEIYFAHVSLALFDDRLGQIVRP